MTNLEIELEEEADIEGLTANFDKNSVKDKLWQLLIKKSEELEEINNLIGRPSSAIFDEYREMKKELKETKEKLNDVYSLIGKDISTVISKRL